MYGESLRVFNVCTVYTYIVYFYSFLFALLQASELVFSSATQRYKPHALLTILTIASPHVPETAEQVVQKRRRRKNLDGERVVADRWNDEPIVYVDNIIVSYIIFFRDTRRESDQEYIETKRRRRVNKPCNTVHIVAQTFNGALNTFLMCRLVDMLHD